MERLTLRWLWQLMAVCVAIPGCSESDNRKPFADLARCIAAELPTAESDDDPELSTPELLANFAEKEELLLKVMSNDESLEPIAADTIMLLEEARTLIESTRGESNALGAGALVLFGLFAEEESTKLEAFARAAALGSDAMEPLRQADRLFTRWWANRLRLARLAPSYSIPTAEEPLVQCGFFEKPLFSDASDTAWIKNISGFTLHDCVTVITLTGEDDQRAIHVHFVSDWKPGEVRYGVYDSGSMGFLRETVSGVTEIGVEVWSREATSPKLVAARPQAGWPSPE